MAITDPTAKVKHAIVSVIVRYDPDEVSKHPTLQELSDAINTGDFKNLIDAQLKAASPPLDVAVEETSASVTYVS